MTQAIRLLLVLGIIAQALLLYASRYELSAMALGSLGGLTVGALALYLSPVILALGGAAIARWARRRGTGWAWLAVGLPLAVLILGLGLALWLTAFPIVLHQR